MLINRGLKMTTSYLIEYKFKYRTKSDRYLRISGNPLGSNILRSDKPLSKYIL
ncbi:hypothetical protein SJAV_05990 [Sulfurisphaera javensis]|uniref:Uncharacterized protein n=1 Tax=Sulfurisphaera javensis TaxID=2049879 RepID=A0AAT9GP27_9CREN